MKICERCGEAEAVAVVKTEFYTLAVCRNCKSEAEYMGLKVIGIEERKENL